MIIYLYLGDTSQRLHYRYQRDLCLLFSLDGMPPSSRHLGTEIDTIVQVHPIHRLPPEILSIIFWHAIPRDKDFVVPSTRNAPLVLRTICKSWRRLADSTPELWASIELFLFRPFTKALQAYHNWISKAGNSLLDFKIVVIQRMQSLSKIYKPLLNFIQCIKNHRHRWRNVELSCPKVVVDLFLDDALPVLERLAISDSLRDDTPWDLGTLDLSGALNLWELKVDEPMRVTPGNRVTAITRLHISIDTESQFLSVITACPLLEELTVTFTSRPSGDFACERPLLLPHLHTLSVLSKGFTHQHTGSILRAFRAAALRKVALSFMEDSSVPHFIDLLDQSGGRIEELTLTEVRIEQMKLIHCLSRLPLLTSLKIADRTSLGDDFLRGLVWRPQRPGGGNVCPRLGRLWLLRCSCNSMDSDIVVELIRSRSSSSSELGPIAPLMELRFDGTQAQQRMLHNHLDIRARIKLFR